MTLPAVDPGTEVADFGDELVLLVPGRRRAVHLPPGPALVFDSCRRGADIDELVTELSAAGRGAETDVVAWVRETLVELARHGAIAPIDGALDRAVSDDDGSTA